MVHWASREWLPICGRVRKSFESSTERAEDLSCEACILIVIHDGKMAALALDKFYKAKGTE